MTLEPGRQLLHYRIVDKLGEGGMGAVWRAFDTSLDREVAIKVLPAGFADDPDRVARFEREAKVVASLNHPNIAAVHAIHEAHGLRFIAQELVPGEDLAERIDRGGIERDDALRIAAQIADGLQAAHDRGVVHRDLKPANVKLEPGGRVKILDFGLAKAFGAGESDGSGSASPSLSPTVTSAGTVAGMILGTAGYMSPEQARGNVADHRSDVWALGCVLFELLTGSRAFDGDTVSDALASVLKVEPDLDRLPPDTPPAIRTLIRRCLAKDPHVRLHAAADARIAIEETLAGTDDGGASHVIVPAPAARRVPWFAVLAVGIVLGLAVGLLGPWRSRPAASAERPVVRAQIPTPGGQPLGSFRPIAISPDGTRLALIVGMDENSRLHVRALADDEAEVVPGTLGARAPRWSPDGTRVAFFADGALKVVSLSGTSRDIDVLADAPTAAQIAWSHDGWIYFTFGESRLARVPEDGGAREELGEVGDVHGMSPLPAGHGILIDTQPVDGASDLKDASTLAVLAPDGRTLTPLVEGGFAPRYAEIDGNGLLVFVRRGSLFAAPFDLAAKRTTGPEVGVGPRVFVDTIWGAARYDLSLDGTLAACVGGDYAYTRPTWVDIATGETEPLDVPAGHYNTFELSPDGTRLAIQNASGPRDQIYVHDLRRGTFVRLTEAGSNQSPIWSHDGREVFFSSNRDGKGQRLYRKPVDGSAPARPLLTEEVGAAMESELRQPSAVTPDGKYVLVYTWGHPTRGGDLWKVPLDGGEPEPLIVTASNEIIPQISPDGRWLAYLSDRTGAYQIHLRPFPDVDRREWVLSTEEGYDARWHPSGRSILYRDGTIRWREVPLGDGDVPEPGAPRFLIETDAHDAAGSSFELSADGRRLLVNRPVEGSMLEPGTVTLVLGWGDETRRKLSGE